MILKEMVFETNRGIMPQQTAIYFFEIIFPPLKTDHSDTTHSGISKEVFEKLCGLAKILFDSELLGSELLGRRRRG